MSRNRAALENYSVIPDTRLKERYGRAEERRHYVDLDDFGTRGVDALEPDIRDMERRFGTRRVMRAGTLPWTITAVSAQLESAWQGGNCRRVLALSGFLSHYVGDMSQPLHTTRFYDGELPSDRGMHARVESAVDRSTAGIERLAEPQIHLRAVKSVWDLVIDGLRESNSLVGEVEQADRSARRESSENERQYRKSLIAHEKSMIASQVADSASRLASIWAYEWDRAGRRAVCAPPVGD